MPEAKINAEEKEHTTVTITEDDLAKLSPCSEGFANAKRFLPVTLSTDPEENLELAITFCRTQRASFWDDPYWLEISIAHDHVLPDADYRVHQRGKLSGSKSDYVARTSNDPWLTAQYLAWVADKLATDQGR